MAAVEIMEPSDHAHRRARARRTAIVLGLVAVAFYVAFVAMSVMQSRGERPPSREWIGAPSQPGQPAPAAAPGATPAPATTER